MCDGIFLNYWWDPQALARSRAAAGARARAVYAGIDVFGRGTYGGGGLQCASALDAICDAGLSAAVFAPGWVFEDAQFDKRDFDASSVRFWGQFEGVFRRRPVVGLPLATTFCAGCGDVYAVEGAVVRRGPWANLSEQTVMPSFAHQAKLNPYFPVLKDAHSALDTFAFEPPRLSYDRAFGGGSCLAIRGAARVTDRTLQRGDRAVFKLIAAEMPLAGPVVVPLTYALEAGGGGGPVTPSLVLVCTTPPGSYHYVTLRTVTGNTNGGGGNAPAALSDTPEQSELAARLRAKYGVAASRCSERGADRLEYLPTVEAGAAALPDRNGWRTDTFVLCDKALKALTAREVRLSVSVAGPPSEQPRRVALDVGAVRVFKVSSAAAFGAITGLNLASATKRRDADGRWVVGGWLRWSPVPGSPSPAFCDVWCGERFVGRTFTDRLFLTGVAGDTKGDEPVRLTVQPVNAALCRTPLAECPVLVVE